MHRLLPAILLSAGLQSSFAAAALPAPAARSPETIVQAQLEPHRAAPPHPAKAGAKDIGQDEEQRPAAMLLAALVLMTGIALRRWGMGQQ